MYFLVFCMVMDANQTYCGDYFSIYTNIESLCCIVEYNVVSQLYLKRKEKCKLQPQPIEFAPHQLTLLPQVHQVHDGTSFGCMSIAFGRLNKEDSKRAQAGSLATLAFNRLQSLYIFKCFDMLSKERDYGLNSNGVISYPTFFF